MEKTMQKLPKWQRFSCLILFCLGSFVFVMRVLLKYELDPDLIWHYFLGKDIFLTGSVSTANPYSWIEGTEWNQSEWLFDLFYYFVTGHLGLIGFYLLDIFRYVILFFIVYSYHKGLDKSFSLYVLLGIMMMVAVPTTMVNRPGNFSTLFILVLLLLYEAASGFRYLWAFLIGIFISNFHIGQGVAFFAFLGVRLFVDLVYVILDKTGIKRLFKCFLFIGCYALGLFFNIRGYRQVFEMFDVAKMASTAYIIEWKPVYEEFSGKVSSGVVLLFCIIILSFIHYLKQYGIDRFFVRDGALVGTAFLLFFFCMKFSVFFIYIYLVFGLFYFIVFIRDNFGFLVGDLYRCSNFVLIGAGISFFIFVTVMVLKLGNNMEDYMQSLAEEQIGKETISVLKDSNARPVHSYNSADYLLAEDIKVFVDTRQQPYAKENGYTSTCDDAFSLMLDISSDDFAAIEGVLSKYDYNYVVCDEGFRLEAYCRYKGYEQITDNLYKVNR